MRRSHGTSGILHEIRKLRQRIEELAEEQISRIQQISHQPNTEDLQVEYFGVPVRATIPGCFYRARDPKSPPFVNEGDHVQEGEPLFIMECSKLFTEIPSPVSGIIVKIFAENDKLVKDHDQIVMYIEPDPEHNGMSVTFTLDGQEIEDEKEKDPYIHSKVVGTVWRIKDTKSPWLVNLGDMVQPNQPILTINQLNKIVKVFYEGDCLSIITQQLVLEGEPVQYGTSVAKVEFIEQESDNSQ